MTNKKCAVVYIAYGPHYLHKQVIISILTLYYFLNERKEFEKINLIVYTDNKEIFEENLVGINIIYELLTHSKIKGYIGQFNHIHRLKICVIKHCFQKYESDILYIDSDTYFLKSPYELLNEISEKKTILHSKEFKLNEGGVHWNYAWGKTLKLVKKHTFKLQEKEFKIDNDAEMWNAGVIGISFSNLLLVDDVLQLTDQISEKSSFFVAEQFAFSYIFFRKTSIIPSDEFIYHYYYEHLKEMYNFHINIFLSQNKYTTIKSKAEKAMLLTKSQNELSLSKGTKIEELKKKLQKMRKYKQSDLDLFIYNLGSVLKNKVRVYLLSLKKGRK